MGIIILEKLRFKAYHGYYDEERERGNQFEVTITIDTNFDEAAKSDELTGTVDYTRVYGIVRDQMQIQSKLLENVALRISETLLQEIQEINGIRTEISKLNAPIGGPCQAATIIYEKSRF